VDLGADLHLDVPLDVRLLRAAVLLAHLRRRLGDLFGALWIDGTRQIEEAGDVVEFAVAGACPHADQQPDYSFGRKKGRGSAQRRWSSSLEQGPTAHQRIALGGVNDFRAVEVSLSRSEIEVRQGGSLWFSDRS
jgi:hypothetical protein